MLVFGVDVPLVEVIFTLALVIFFLLVESIIVVALLLKQMNKTKQLTGFIKNLSDTLLQIKKAEVDELERLKQMRR